MPSDDKNQLVHWLPMIKMWDHIPAVIYLFRNDWQYTDGTIFRNWQWGPLNFMTKEIIFPLWTFHLYVATFQQHFNIPPTPQYTNFIWLVKRLHW